MSHIPTLRSSFPLNVRAHGSQERNSKNSFEGQHPREKGAQGAATRRKQETFSDVCAHKLAARNRVGIIYRLPITRRQRGREQFITCDQWLNDQTYDSAVPSAALIHCHDNENKKMCFIKTRVFSSASPFSLGDNADQCRPYPHSEERHLDLETGPGNRKRYQIPPGIAQ